MPLVLLTYVMFGWWFTPITSSVKFANVLCGIKVYVSLYGGLSVIVMFIVKFPMFVGPGLLQLKVIPVELTCWVVGVCVQNPGFSIVVLTGKFPSSSFIVMCDV